jgi:hypothetical protein
LSGWIGVDLDGTLAHYGGWNGGGIGKPILPMLLRVREWLVEGKDVRIFTARVGVSGNTNDEGQNDSAQWAQEQREKIQDWTENYLGVRLPVTATKDFAMIELWDDRAVQVEMNTGRRVDGRE